MNEAGPLGLSTDQLDLLDALIAEEGLDGGEETALPRREDPGERPLSFAQRRLWFLAQLEPEAASYNVPAAVRLTGEVDEAALEGAVREIVRRHEVLRTGFTAAGGQPAQVLAPPPRWVIAVVDLAALPRGARRAAAEALARREARLPFDLGTSPLLRATLVRLAGDERLLLIDMHHIVSDGWSAGVFVRETAALYRAFSRGAPSPLPELPIQYPDYAAWQERWLAGGPLAEQLAWWRRALEGIPHVLELPGDRPRPPVETFRGATLGLRLEPELSLRLLARARERGVSPFMLLLAAFQVLLSRHAGQARFLVGSPIAGRTRSELEGLIGFFVNTLALPADLSDDPPFDRLLARVEEATLGAYDHQDLPFERLVAELAPQRDRSRTPLFQVLFAFQNAPAETLAIPGVTIEPVELDSGTAKFDLSLSMAESAGSLAGSLEYSTDLFDGATARRLLARFRTLLAAVAADPGRRVGELAITTPAERWQLLGEWNDTGAPRRGAVDHCVYLCLNRPYSVVDYCVYFMFMLFLSTRDKVLRQCTWPVAVYQC